MCTFPNMNSTRLRIMQSLNSILCILCSSIDRTELQWPFAMPPFEWNQTNSIYFVKNIWLNDRCFAANVFADHDWREIKDKRTGEIPWGVMINFTWQRVLYIYRLLRIQRHTFHNQWTLTSSCQPSMDWSRREHPWIYRGEMKYVWFRYTENGINHDTS